MTAKILVVTVVKHTYNGYGTSVSSCMETIEFDDATQAQTAAAIINKANGEGPSGFSKYKPNEVDHVKVTALVL